MQKIKATPTSYKGQNFKSKSEAIFARLLDLRQFTWEYEPLHYAFESYVPDFHVVFESKPDHRLVQFIIEYKPCSPSPMYLHKFNNYVSYLDKINHNIPIQPLIVYGNFFQSPVKLMCIGYCSENLFKHFWEGENYYGKKEYFKLNNIYREQPHDFKFFDQSQISQARKYRFDLKQ